MTTKNNSKKYKTYYMESENVKQLEKVSKETRLTKSVIVNMALEEYFSKKK